MTYNEFISKFEIYPSYHAAQSEGYEAHHIIPKALQKSNETFDDRCVRLTAYDHIYAHYLLALEREDAVEVFYRMVNVNKFKLSDIEKVTLEDLEHWATLRKQGREKLKGIPKSLETRKRMSEARKGKSTGPLSEETKQKLSKIRKGVPKSEEMKKKLSEAKKGHLVSEETKEKISNTKKGKPGPNKGKVWSEEHKKKISETLTGHPSPMKGKHHSLETIQQMSDAKKDLIWITDGVSSRHIHKDEPIPEGFKRGMKPSDAKKNLIWITDGKINTRISKDTPIPEGFVKGRTLKTA